MKYEMIFGDESLFDGVRDGIVALRFVNGSGGKLLHCKEGQIDGLVEADFINHPIVAMRRIIKEPKRWTWEDMKAGRLPEVGVKVTLNLSDEVVKSSAIQSWENGDELEVLRTFKKDEPKGKYASALFNLRTKTCGLVLTEYLSPIETPAEKAQRLEDEFINYVLHHEKIQINSSEELNAAKRAIKLTYKLQLSGELAAPKGGDHD